MTVPSNCAASPTVMTSATHRGEQFRPPYNVPERPRSSNYAPALLRRRLRGFLMLSGNRGPPPRELVDWIILPSVGSKIKKCIALASTRGKKMIPMAMKVHSTRRAVTWTFAIPPEERVRHYGCADVGDDQDELEDSAQGHARGGIGAGSGDGSGLFRTGA